MKWKRYKYIVRHSVYSTQTIKSHWTDRHFVYRIVNRKLVYRHVKKKLNICWNWMDRQPLLQIVNKQISFSFLAEIGSKSEQKNSMRLMLLFFFLVVTGWHSLIEKYTHIYYAHIQNVPLFTTKLDKTCVYLCIFFLCSICTSISARYIVSTIAIAALYIFIFQ